MLLFSWLIVIWVQNGRHGHVLASFGVRTPEPLRGLGSAAEDPWEETESAFDQNLVERILGSSSVE
jgi:hypothetical protein